MNGDSASASILTNFPAENIRLLLNQNPFPQSNDSTWSIDNVVYRDCDLFVCTGGSAQFLLNGQPCDLTEGTGLLAAPGQEVCARKTGKANFCAVAQHFELTVFDKISFFSLIEYNPCIRFENWPWIHGLLRRHVAGVRKKPLFSHALFRLIITDFIQTAYLGDKALDPDYRFLVEVITLINRNLTDPGLIDKIHGMSPYSADHTTRIFKKYMEMPPKNYILRRRLRTAKDYLMQGHQVKEAAAFTGFTDELYFSRLFKKYEGLSPAEFKKVTSGTRRLETPEGAEYA